MVTCPQFWCMGESRRFCEVSYDCILSQVRTLLLGFVSPGLTLLHTHFPCHRAWCGGGGIHGPGLQPGPPVCTQLGSFFLWLPEVPFHMLLTVPVSSSRLWPPSCKEKQRLSLTSQVACAPHPNPNPNPQTLMYCLCLFSSQWVASSPLIPPDFLPGCHPTVLFYNSAEKQNL